MTQVLTAIHDHLVVLWPHSGNKLKDKVLGYPLQSAVDSLKRIHADVRVFDITPQPHSYKLSHVNHLPSFTTNEVGILTLDRILKYTLRLDGEMDYPNSNDTVVALLVHNSFTATVLASLLFFTAFMDTMSSSLLYVNNLLSNKMKGRK
eukprot:TRINITY_DN8564_c0_g1_i1.p1 TRINITY_DN8564_c0_g1~~TRINITY_DN8564_c0_g1_i1.p1  ORF type:complete len:172 (-),score=21.33 TRINITY_DN8564_c0_g1_i1:163-609(-)